MVIQKMRLEDLNPAKYNPRKELRPGDPEFEKLKRSIETFGYVELIVVNKRTNNTVISGHQRLNVLKYLNAEEVECVVVDLSENDEKALNIAMNKIGGEWDYPQLTMLLKELADDNFDVTLTGFDNSEITDFFDEASEVQEVDTPDEEEVEPITQFGDLWELGEHKLLCGDSTEDNSEKFGGGLCDLLITDPPYNVDYEGTKGMQIMNDSMSENDFYNFLSAAFKATSKFLKPGAPFYIWHGTNESINFITACTKNLGTVRQILIWNKNAFTLGRQDYQWKHEPCLYGWTNGAAHYFTADRSQATVLDDLKQIKISQMKKDELVDLVKKLTSSDVPTTVINEDKPFRNPDHPTMKPIKLLARHIKNSSQLGEIVFDAFGGSGSTLMACEQLGRKCYTVELDPKYCDVIVKRWEQFTGKEAKLIRGGKPCTRK